MTRATLLTLMGILAGALAILVGGEAMGMPPALVPVAALMLFTIGCWASGALPDYLVALLFFLAAIVFGLATPEVVFAGFTRSAFWLVVGGMVLGVAVDQTGLGRRFGGSLSQVVKGSYLRQLATIGAGAAALALLVPSGMARVMLVLPIARALSTVLGHEPGSRSHAGIMLTAIFATTIPGFAILTANLPNIVLLGAMETAYGLTPGFVDYLFLQFPVLGVFSVVSLVTTAAIMFSDGKHSAAGEAPEGRPWTAAEARLLAILAISLLFWLTDSLHGISPAWVSLAAAALCLLPGVGFVDRGAFAQKVNHASIYYVAGVLGVVSLVATSGFGTWLGARLLEVLPLSPDRPALSHFSLVLVDALIGIAATTPNIPAIITPAAEQIASVSGLPLMAVLMGQVAAYPISFFPYQTAPLAVGVALAAVPLRWVVPWMSLNGLIALLVTAPAHFFWLRWAGIFG